MFFPDRPISNRTNFSSEGRMSNPVAFFLSAGAHWAGVSILALTLAWPLCAQDTKHIPTDEALNQVVTRVKPDYPEIAKQIRVSGQVQLEATIDEQGAVVSVKTLNGNPILAKAAVDALKKWKFKPFKEDGKPVKVASDFTLDFKQ
jgi:TonB family protein